jgi:hypothetical protein
MTEPQPTLQGWNAPSRVIREFGGADSLVTAGNYGEPAGFASWTRNGGMPKRSETPLVGAWQQTSSRYGLGWGITALHFWSLSPNGQRENLKRSASGTLVIPYPLSFYYPSVSCFPDKIL